MMMMNSKATNNFSTSVQIFENTKIEGETYKVRNLNSNDWIPLFMSCKSNICFKASPKYARKYKTPQECETALTSQY